MGRHFSSPYRPRFPPVARAPSTCPPHRARTMTTATWTVRIGKNERYYVSLRGSRLRYPADSRLHAHRLASALNRGASGRLPRWRRYWRPSARRGAMQGRRGLPRGPGWRLRSLAFSTRNSLALPLACFGRPSIAKLLTTVQAYPLPSCLAGLPGRQDSGLRVIRARGLSVGGHERFPFAAISSRTSPERRGPG